VRIKPSGDVLWLHLAEWNVAERTEQVVGEGLESLGIPTMRASGPVSLGPIQEAVADNDEGVATVGSRLTSGLRFGHQLVEPLERFFLVAAQRDLLSVELNEIPSPLAEPGL
jgi:hypothetical protein